ncbi:hypothetical protein VTO73DRAFT_261 [Trametes versicolor]
MDTSTCAVHSCLRISDITQIIVDSLCRSGSKKTLASLAQTCKTMQEECMPALWAYQESLKPLLRLLPSDAFAAPPEEIAKFPFVITHPEHLDWTRFDHYAQYVRHFVWKYDDPEKSHPKWKTPPPPALLRWLFPPPLCISPQALSALATHRSDGQPLMPQLHTLVWEEQDPKVVFHPHLFLPPTILRLQLTSEVSNPSMVVPLLKKVGVACRHITHLRMHVYHDKVPWTSADYDAFAQILRGMLELEALDGYSQLSVSCVEALAALPKLAALELHQEQMHALATSAVTGARAGQWFNVLGCLRLSTEQMDKSTMAFVTAIQSQRLRELQLRIVTEPGTHALKQHFETLARSPHRKSLNIFRFTYAFSFKVDGTKVPLDLENTLQPFYAFPHMRLFAIRAHSTLVNARQALHDIANAWPELEGLVLSCYQKDPIEAVAGCASLEDLVQLVRRCPRLRELEMHLNAEAVPDAATLARLLPDPSQSLLESLVLYNAPIGDVDQVADFLARASPALRQIYYMGAAEGMTYRNGQDPSTPLAKWHQVKCLLQEKAKAKSESAAPDSSSPGRSSAVSLSQTPYFHELSWC